MMNGDSIGAEQPIRYAFCGDGSRNCLDAAREPWREVQEPPRPRTTARARAASHRSSHTSGADARHAEHAPERHLPECDRARGPDLRARRDDAARAVGGAPPHVPRRGHGCDVLAIPHNSNLSAGGMFRVEDTPDRDAAAARVRAEPLVEMMQHKGDSECLPGLGQTDEQCGFEKLPYDRFGGKYYEGLHFAPEPASFVRTALGAGLAAGAKLGVNPFQLGFIASTDTHIAAAGFVDEDSHPGHGGASTARKPEGPNLPDDLEYNPGGLAVLWAEENSRDALFAAMRRREAYGTSGPRFIVRTFGGWSFPSDLCGDLRFAERGYEGGVPMGGVLAPAPAADASPRFAIAALRDPGTRAKPGGKLERVQVIKVSLVNGAPKEEVIDVAGRAGDGGTIDPRTCTPSGRGADSLCIVWTDPSFDPRAPAAYYVRVLEAPSCRWNAYVCNASGLDCEKPSTVPPGLASCCDAAVEKTIQERAWTSPIWYTPDAPTS
jgi:hypothetical protein